MPLDRQPTLDGPTLRLRPLCEADREALAAAASDALIWEQHPDRDRGTPAGFARYFDEALASGGALLIATRDGAVIGSSRYDHLDPERPSVEIGWTFLVRAHWGGATNGELKRLMLDHAFTAVDVVVFRVGAENRRSRRAVEKLGAALVDTVAVPGLGDHAVYELPREAYAVASAR